MNSARNPLLVLGYALLGLIALIVAAKIVLWAIRVLAMLVAALITLALAAAVGYLAYLLLRAMLRASQ